MFSEISEDLSSVITNILIGENIDMPMSSETCNISEEEYSQYNSIEDFLLSKFRLDIEYSVDIESDVYEGNVYLRLSKIGSEIYLMGKIYRPYKERSIKFQYADGKYSNSSYEFNNISIIEQISIDSINGDNIQSDIEDFISEISDMVNRLIKSAYGKVKKFEINTGMI